MKTKNWAHFIPSLSAKYLSNFLAEILKVVYKQSTTERSYLVLTANKPPLSLGEQLDKELKGKNRTDFAKRIGISRRQLYNLLGNKRKLTFEVAQNLGRETGTCAKFWLQLELSCLLEWFEVIGALLR